jgi:hypothetical protein
MKTIEVKIYYFNELTTAAQQIAIDQFRNIKYEDSSNECDYEFTAEENKILLNAANKFNDHMEEVLNRIEQSIEWQFSDECIAEDIEINEYEYTADGKRYL